ncbi:hypothetical protein DFH08DRAFT_696425 [Mycena albidolilacea]|uniref:Uncharacterized protein n=1 Tax=Mycena albidolilacea TaxID=1033008 RepID=A0AAD7ESW2_9AGAR|nr:hypothetical protein DFH08DRAFT_696425 [Mycena albidolilacea]
MQFAILSSLLTALAALTQTALAANCGGAGGTANGECVMYNGGSCSQGAKLGSYRPTCTGNCFQYSTFYSITPEGDGTYGTDCVVYSDSNCQHEIADTGNQISGGPCFDIPQGGNSMKCYYRCH